MTKEPDCINHKSNENENPQKIMHDDVYEKTQI